MYIGLTRASTLKGNEPIFEKKKSMQCMCHREKTKAECLSVCCVEITYDLRLK